uniref:Olfactory receptor 6 n=1 Tax=Nannospalax galili TaxID=1026970 RepID=A0A0N9ND02_NANGA|nr:olfactory receptor 6 [Nannospalax galili]ALG93911.1 olfactory receptor 6 [Nannospalax galili]ALG93935.1 olfactory receptor 6 [Nannospalax galili]ALG93941.1 olfactory receptor 6 [Nannospalax galili]ALG93951.1 olfactory receptor 6 [Nannospalax galili]
MFSSFLRRKIMHSRGWRNHRSVTEFILLGFSRNPRTNWILFFLFLYLFTVLGNGLIVTLIRVDARLHTPMYFFLSILSLLDLSYATTMVPQMLIHLVSKKRTISYVGCLVQMYIFLTVGITETWIFAAMAYDRYVAICYPLHYGVQMSQTLCITLVVSSTLCGLICALVYTVFAMNLPCCGPNEINHFFCKILAVLKLACADTFLSDQVDFILGFILLLIPLSLILASYIHIFMSILRIHSTQGWMKAFSTCASNITVVTMFCIPCMVMSMRPGSESSPEDDKKVALFYNVISAFLNPIIYSFQNKDVKKAFLKLIGMIEDTH